MCEYGTTKPVSVKIPADLSATGKSYWKRAQIDACIAPLVEALQDAGIDMRGSCCGHGKREGHIQLQDGRCLLILNPEQAEQYLAHISPGSSIGDWLLGVDRPKAATVKMKGAEHES